MGVIFKRDRPVNRVAASLTSRYETALIKPFQAPVRQESTLVVDTTHSEPARVAREVSDALARQSSVSRTAAGRIKFTSPKRFF